jgi:hypothetical protein
LACGRFPRCAVERWDSTDESQQQNSRTRSGDLHNWSLAFNALLLFRAYVSCALTVTGTKMDLVNTDVQVIVDALLPPTSGTSLAWSWLQAQIAAQGLFAFYYKLAKHAEQLEN